MLRGPTLNHNTSITKSFMVLNTTVASCALISGMVIWMHESEPGFMSDLHDSYQSFVKCVVYVFPIVISLKLHVEGHKTC
jgi:hypothetical protein